MRCSKCGKEQDKGKFYDYYYGTLLSSKVSGYYPGATITKRFQVNGKASSWICRNCIFKEITYFSLIWFFPPILFFSIFVYLNESNPGVVLIFLGLAGLWGLAGFVFFEEKNFEFGSGMAIKINENNLGSQGFDVFFTPKNYSKFSNPLNKIPEDSSPSFLRPEIHYHRYIKRK